MRVGIPSRSILYVPAGMTPPPKPPKRAGSPQSAWVTSLAAASPSTSGAQPVNDVPVMETVVRLA